MSAGEKEIPLQSGDIVTVTLLEDGELYLDSIAFSYAKPIDRFTVGVCRKEANVWNST